MRINHDHLNKTPCLAEIGDSLLSLAPHNVAH